MGRDEEDARGQTLEKIKSIISQYTSAPAKLQKLAPDFAWSNLLGDYGEYVAIEKYNLKKAPTGQKGYDAIDSKGRTVQIKTRKRAKNRTADVSLSKGPDRLLAILVNDDASWEEVYFGPFEKIWRDARKEKTTRVITFTRLRQIAENTASPLDGPTVFFKGKEVTKDTDREMYDYLKQRGHPNLPSYPTLTARSHKNTRMKKSSKPAWTDNQRFGIDPPPLFMEFNHLVKDEGYEWYPHFPQKNAGKAFPSPIEKRVYLSQSEFGKKHDIPTDFISDQLKKKPPLSAAEIIQAYDEVRKKR